MPRNALVIGPPRSGKTTALARTVDRLREVGIVVGGLASPEVRVDGNRVGFDAVDLARPAAGRERMADVSFTGGPTVGKYGVDVDAVDRVAVPAIRDAVADADCVVIDEIAPMQVASARFVDATRTALDAPVPVLAAIQTASTDGFVGAVKAREDVVRFAVEQEARDELPGRLAAWVRDAASAVE